MADPTAPPSRPGGPIPPVAGLPTEVAAAVAGATWFAAPGGVSGARVDRLVWDDGRVAYLKTGDGDPDDPGSLAGQLAAEADRLRWLAGRLAVPEVLAWSSDPDGASLLLTGAVAGTPAADPVVQQDPEALVLALAAGLRRVHELSPVGAPGDAGIEPRLARARDRVARDLVDQSDFEPAYARYRPDELLAHLDAARPSAPEDLVVVHGDPSLANLLVGSADDGGLEVVGYVDLGAAGVADRYLDLAICARSLANRISPEVLGPFFHAYGIEAPDLLKVDFYVLLDEFS